MSEAIRFLHAFAQAVATLALYTPGHPATRRAIQQAFQALQDLLAIDDHPNFLFLGGAPVFAGRALHELSEWPWSRRLSDAAVQRIEFDARLTEDGMALLFDRLMARLGGADPTADQLAVPIDGVMYGPVTVYETEIIETDSTAPPIEGSKELQVDLSDELDAVGYVMSEAAKGALARAESEAIVRILGSLVDDHLLPQALPGTAPYPVVHAVNTALLVMSAAMATGIEKPSRQRLGVSALLHDIGMALLPAELIERETLTPDERARLETHPVRGARLLVEGGPGMAMAAVVAYEHHLRPDGTGYPLGRFRVAPHWASRLVGAASAYVALRSPRPFRPAWSAERAVRHLEDGAGTVFDADSARLLAVVVRPS